MDQKTDYEKLDEVRIGSTNTGHPLMRIGVQAQFFLSDGALPETRVRGVEALAAFAQLAGENVTRILPSGASRLKPLAGAGFPQKQLEDAASARAGDVFGLRINDGQVPPQWQAVSQMVGDYAPDLQSYFYTAVPASFMKRDPDRYVAAVVEWASILRPDYGTAGFALISEAGLEAQNPTESWPLHARFPGLDILGAFNLTRKPGKIQSVSWLTVLGQGALAAIGGREALSDKLAQAWAEVQEETPRATLPPDFFLHDYDGGLVIRAGQYPQMGDINMDNIPETYRTVNAALRPIRFGAYQQRPSDLIKTPASFDRYTETLNWVRRFDGRR